MTNTILAASGLEIITQGHPNMWLLNISPYLNNQKKKSNNPSLFTICNITSLALTFLGTTCIPFLAVGKERIGILFVKLESFTNIRPAHGTRWQGFVLGVPPLMN